MNTDALIMHDAKTGLHFIVATWKKNVPENLITFKKLDFHPYSKFKRIDLKEKSFGGIMYNFGKNFIALLYPGKPAFCEYVLMQVTGNVNDTIDFIIDLDDAGSLPR